MRFKSRLITREQRFSLRYKRVLLVFSFFLPSSFILADSTYRTETSMEEKIETIQIANKSFSKIKDDFSEKEGLYLDLSNDFLNQFLKEFSYLNEINLEKLIKGYFKSLISLELGFLKEQGLLKHEGDLKVSLRLKEKLPQITDVYPIKEFVFEKRIDLRSVILQMTFTQSERSMKRERDMHINTTRFAKNKLSNPPLRLIAIHEAGHALTNIAEKTGAFLNYVTILRSEHSLGHVEYDYTVSGFKNHLSLEIDDYAKLSMKKKEFLLFIIAKFLAGNLAERKVGYVKYYTPLSYMDLKIINSILARPTFERESLYSKLKTWVKDKVFKPEAKTSFSDEDKKRFHRISSEAFLEGAEKLTHRLLDLNWDKIERLADEALEKKKCFEKT